MLPVYIVKHIAVCYLEPLLVTVLTSDGLFCPRSVFDDIEGGCQEEATTDDTDKAAHV